MEWAYSRIGMVRNIYRNLFGKLEGKKLLGRHGRTCKYKVTEYQVLMTDSPL